MLGRDWVCDLALPFSLFPFFPFLLTSRSGFSSSSVFVCLSAFEPLWCFGAAAAAACIASFGVYLPCVYNDILMTTGILWGIWS